jgi:hypothetical protein
MGICAQWLPEGRRDLATVVGESVFTIPMPGGAEAPAPSLLESVQLPCAIGQACVRLAHQFGLVFAQLHLIGQGDGTWTCLDINPFPSIDDFPPETQDAIVGALADRLALTREVTA